MCHARFVPVLSRTRGRVRLATLALAVTLGVSEARADESGELEKARAAYLAKDYEEADRRLARLLDPTSPLLKEPALVAQARMYWGAVLLARGRGEEATLLFEKLLLDDPLYEPDPLSFASAVVDAFIDARSKMRDRLNQAAQQRAQEAAERRARELADRQRQAARLRLLEKLAAEQRVTVKSSRVVATIPFGVGQFQNRQSTLGWVFLGLESALVVGTAVTVPLYVDARTRALEELSSGDPEKRASGYNERAGQIRIVNLALAGGLAGVAALGVVQAHASYVPEHVDIVPRAVPQVAKVRPVLAPLAGGGAFVGLDALTF